MQSVRKYMLSCMGLLGFTVCLNAFPTLSGCTGHLLQIANQSGL